jgi:hypothetical protein
MHLFSLQRKTNVSGKIKMDSGLCDSQDQKMSSTPINEARRIAANVAKLPGASAEGIARGKCRHGLSLWLPAHHEKRDRPKTGNTEKESGLSPNHVPMLTKKSDDSSEQKWRDDRAKLPRKRFPAALSFDVTDGTGRSPTPCYLITSRDDALPPCHRGTSSRL